MLSIVGRKETQISANAQMGRKPDSPLKGDRIDVHTRISKSLYERIKAESVLRFGSVDIQAFVRLAITDYFTRKDLALQPSTEETT